MFKELTKEDLGGREVARANSQAGETIMNIPLSKIVVRDGFNVREDFGDIEGLAKSIIKNSQTVAARVDVLVNGTFMLVDGNRRYLALKWIEQHEGYEPKLKAVVNVKTTTEEERLIQMFTTQDNKQLEPYEAAEAIKRFINLSYTQKEVAEQLGKTPAYISQMLSFAREGNEIKQHVKKGNISLSTVVKLQSKIPSQSKRTEEVRKAVDNSKTGKRVTIDEVGGKAVKPIELFKAELNSKIIIGHLNNCDDRYNEAIIEVLDMLERYKF